MTIIAFFALILMIVGIVILLDLTPENMTKDVVRILDYEESLYIQAKEARGKSSTRRITRELNAIRYAQQVMGKEKQFAVVCSAALALFVAGLLLAALLKNWLLAPVLGVIFAAIPFLYVKSTMKSFEKTMNEELETALSIITTSYVRNDDIIASVRENINYIKPPVKNMMIAFVNQATVISSNIKTAIADLRNASSNYIFREWCDTLLSCQDDRTQKTSLLPIVAKFTDVRQVNNDLQTMIISPRSEYFTMAALVLLNYPLIYLLNKDWFGVLINTTIGKATTAIIALVVAVTAAIMFKLTKPIEYKK